MSAPPVHLDTSFLIRALVAGSAESTTMARWLESGRPVAVSAMAWAEFSCGPVGGDALATAAQVLGEPLPVSGRHADLAARLFNAAGRRRSSLADCLVAAVAIEAESVLATADARFERLVGQGLQLVP